MKQDQIAFDAITSALAHVLTMCVLTLSEPLAFTCTDAFQPRVLKLSIPGVSTFLEPSTTTSTATEFARFF